MLLLDLVVESDVREARGVVRRRRIGRRAREPVAQHVRDDDEVLGRVQGHAVSDQPLVVPVAPRVPGRVHDRVALVGVQLAVCLVRELGVAQRRAVLQRHIAEIEDLVVLRELIHRNGTSSSWKAPASASSARPVPDGLSVTPVYPKCLDASDDNEHGWVLLVTRCIRSRRMSPAPNIWRAHSGAVDDCSGRRATAAAGMLWSNNRAYSQWVVRQFGYEKGGNLPRAVGVSPAQRHLMPHPIDGRWSGSTGRPASTASTAARTSAAVTGRSFRGRESSSWPR